MRVKVKPKKPLNWDKILQFIPPKRRKVVKEISQETYWEVVTTNWPLVEEPPNERGFRVLRFKADPMTEWMHTKINLGDLWKACYLMKTWNRRRLEDYYRGLGYSLCGFAEVFRSGKPKWWVS